jgi:predicted Zn-dependent protease
MRFVRRAAASTVIFSLLFCSSPLRALAVSTQDQVRAGQAEDEQITRSEVVENDPLLNAYVRGVAHNLWLQVERKDLPYNVKVLKANDVNAFSTEGGFVYVDEGMLGFVQSDDELAGVLGHETGHIERNHVITMNTKAQILNLLLGLASMFSPFIYETGGLIGATVMAKMSREDELEADRTGLQLMARAGYDPEAMVTMMSHMNALADQHSDLVDKYLQDHPDPKDRVAHLVGYPELDPTKVTEQQRLVQAISDEERGRYSYAALKLQKILQSDPHNADALLRLAQAQLALGQTSKSAQTLAEAAQAGSSQARRLVEVREASLREMETNRALQLRADPNFGRLSRSVDAERDRHIDAAQQIGTRQSQAQDQFQAVQSRLKDIQYLVPNFGNIDVRPNSRLAAIMSNLEAMSRAVSSGMDDAKQVIDGVGTLDPKKPDKGGLLRNGQEILGEMAAPLQMHPVPDESIAIFPSYSNMLDEMGHADDDALRSIDAARGSLTQMDIAIGDLDDLLRTLDRSYVSFGDISMPDYNALVPEMTKVMQEFNTAAVSASQAAQLYNMASARQYSVRISLLGVGDSPQRYATLQHALDVRFGSNGIPYRTMLRDGASPGEVVAATILSADCNQPTAATVLSCDSDPTTPQSIIETAKRRKMPVIDLANSYGMHAWPMEIFMRLTYLDYTDDPAKEISNVTQSGGQSGI